MKFMEPVLEISFDFGAEDKKLAAGKKACKREGRHQYNVHLYRLYGKMETNVFCVRCRYSYTHNREYKPFVWTEVFTNIH